jgi:hypothetical protein
MRTTALGLILSSSVLAACTQSTETASSKAHGRFTGVGVFNAGKLWGEIATATQPRDPAAAKITDDEHVIVVLDTHTGDVRECGDLSGYCVEMTPWAADRATAPIKLSKHASDLETVNETSAN